MEFTEKGGASEQKKEAVILILRQLLFQSQILHISHTNDNILDFFTANRK